MWSVICSFSPQSVPCRSWVARLSFMGGSRSLAKPRLGFRGGPKIGICEQSSSPPLLLRSSLVLALMTRVWFSGGFEHFKALHRKEQPLGTGRKDCGPRALLSPDCSSELLLNYREQCLAWCPGRRCSMGWGGEDFTGLARAQLPSPAARPEVSTQTGCVSLTVTQSSQLKSRVPPQLVRGHTPCSCSPLHCSALAPVPHQSPRLGLYFLVEMTSSRLFFHGPQHITSLPPTAVLQPRGGSTTLPEALKTDTPVP